jgi:hypothetical protein
MHMYIYVYMSGLWLYLSTLRLYLSFYVNLTVDYSVTSNSPNFFNSSKNLQCNELYLYCKSTGFPVIVYALLILTPQARSYRIHTKYCSSFKIFSFLIISFVRKIPSYNKLFPPCILKDFLYFFVLLPPLRGLPRWQPT